MKAMVLEHDGDVTTSPLKFREIPIPQPGPGQVRVKVHVCGVCRTDLHVIEGELPPVTRPIIPGHETVGIIDQLGSGVSQLKEGDRVGIAWIQATCQTCHFCQSGRENLCERAMFTGYHVNGGYAEYALVSERFAYPIPDIFSNEEAAPLLCAGIIGYRALQRSQVRPGQRLGLYGFGASAHITIQIALHRGCEVYVCSLHEEHRNLAQQLGAAWVGEAADMPPRTLHSAILFAPAGELVPLALRALEKGGTLALAGIYMTPIPLLDYTLDLFHERTLQSVTANTRQDGLDLFKEAASIPIRTHTTPYPLEQANAALQDLKSGTVQGAAVLHVSSSS